MILQGAYGKTLFFWTSGDEITITLRGPSGTQDWTDTFPLEEALRFFLAAAMEIAERMRQRESPGGRPPPP